MSELDCPVGHKIADSIFSINLRFHLSNMRLVGNMFDVVRILRILMEKIKKNVLYLGLLGWAETLHFAQQRKLVL
jgi:hypothetical protein